MPDRIRAAVRGEEDWSVLTALGATIVETSTGLSMKEPPGLPTYSATPQDVATGFISTLTRGTDLKQWARVLLATGTVELDQIEDHPFADEILEAVWDAAGGSEPAEAQLALMRRLLQENESSSSEGMGG